MSRIHGSIDTTLTMQSLAAPDTVFSKSVFTSHQLHTENFRVNAIQRLQPDWILGILVTCFILFAWTQVFYPKRVQQIFRSPFSKRFINQLTRDGNLFRERVSVAMGIVYVLTFSLLLFECNEQILKIKFPLVQGITLYWAITLFNLTYLIIKVTLIQFLGIVFKTRETTYNYLLNMLIFSLISAPVMLVALVFALYLKTPVLLPLCLTFFILQFLFRLFRGFFIGIALTKFSYLFLFVYLCTLEILPLLVIAKVLLSQAQSAGG
jgi:hypothetical protein